MTRLKKKIIIFLLLDNLLKSAGVAPRLSGNMAYGISFKLNTKFCDA